jgi:hypothetical protein
MTLQVSVSAGGLDYETATSHAVVIRVRDQGTTPRSTSVYLTVTVTDLNESPPVISGTPLTASASESAAIGTTVKTVAATDADDSDVITFSLSDTTYLEIDASSGAVVIK